MPRLALLLLLVALPVLARDRDDDDEDMDIEAPAPSAAPARMQIDFDAVELKSPGYVSTPDVGTFSAKAGGIQDIASYREAVARGEIPKADLLFSEGLFSEYDLPARKVGPCDALLCPLVEAGGVALRTRPEVGVVAQIGFDTNLDMAGWERPPLSLVLVMDISGSMHDSGSITAAALAALGAQLGPRDRVAVVQVGRSSRLALPVLAGDQARTVLPGLVGASDGGSNLLSGLEMAVGLAERELVPDGGLVRVVAFSDFLPNAGAAYQDAFVELAERAARRGVALTGVAVGPASDLRLAEPISRVRGGNLVTVPTVQRAREAFGADFDSLVVPLANDFSLEILPASGWRLVGVYGIPGAALRWDEGGSARLSVATLFLSRKAGAIYLAFAPETVSGLPAPPLEIGGSVGTLGLSYAPLGGMVTAQDRTISLEEPVGWSVGLRRGLVLIDEVEALHALSLAAHGGDIPGARSEALALRAALARAEDPALAPELALAMELVRLTGG